MSVGSVFLDEYTRDAILDMLEHAQELVDLADRTDIEELLAERLPRLGVERLFEIIGEAASRVPEHVQKRIDVPWREIKGLRNLLAHAYHRTDPTTLSGIIRDDLPRLIEEIERFLGAQD